VSATAISDRVAVVGVGETDYRADYQRSRRAELGAPVGEPDRASSAEDLDEAPSGFAAEAFTRALADAGLEKGDIDGLAVCAGRAEEMGFERTAEILGLTVRWGAETGLPDHIVQVCVDGLAAGRCSTVAIVYGNGSRGRGAKAYGGVSEPRSGYMNQWYYHVWGFSSPGAQYAFTYQEYLDRLGCGEEELGAVAVAFRKNARLNPNAVMQDPMTIEQYLAARYTFRPLRLYDCCMVNDGGACLILQRADIATSTNHRPVLVGGVGRYSPYARHTQMGFRRHDAAIGCVEEASAECLGMAGVTPDDIDLVQCYDGFSVQLPMFLEGLGVCEPWEGLSFIQQGRIERDGVLPCNTGGGLLSESYMHGMNLHIEAVRQLRHEAGERQIAGAETAAYCHHGHWGAISMLYRRG